MSGFIRKSEVRQEEFDWGSVGWRLTPESGAKHLVVMDVVLKPGGGHSFHYHPGQEEIIIVKKGSITQYIEQESTTLEPLDCVFIDADVVHASFNDGDEVAEVQVVIAPSSGEGTGYVLQDVYDQEPWASLRGG